MTVCLSVCLFVCVFVCVFVCLCVCWQDYINTTGWIFMKKRKNQKMGFGSI